MINQEITDVNHRGFLLGEYLQLSSDVWYMIETLELMNVTTVGRCREILKRFDWSVQSPSISVAELQWFNSKVEELGDFLCEWLLTGSAGDEMTGVYWTRSRDISRVYHA